MNKNIKYYIWILFILIIPALYIGIKILIPNAENIESIITIGTYIIAVLTLMYRIDIKLYFFIQKIILPFKYSFTSWVLSARYNSINNENSVDCFEKEIMNLGVKILKKENNFINFIWDSRNVINIRVENNYEDEKSIHLYTSKIDVPIKENSKKIRNLCSLFERIENSIDMLDRNNKEYEIDIEYSNKSPFYSFWIKNLPEEKIYQFNCTVKIDDENGTIGVNKNHVRIHSNSFSELFHRLDYFLTLRST